MTGLYIILLLFFMPVQEKPSYPLKDGRPTSRGIDLYVEDNADRLVMELQVFLGDTLYNTNIYTEDLSGNQAHNPLELGNYYPNEIFINNGADFLAYEVSELPRKSLDTIVSSNQFVKAAVIHELMHHYIYQVSIEMLRQDGVGVDRAYQSFFRIYKDREDPGPRFIEEGICEYANLKLKETISGNRPWIPRKAADIGRPEREYDLYYRYATYALQDFLDNTGLKRGIKILLHNPPPTVEEILDPDLFFARLTGLD